MATRQKFDYSITTGTGRVVARFSLLSEAQTAADALARAYGEPLGVEERGYEGYVYRTGN
jgi:hypothetical protein